MNQKNRYARTDLSELKGLVIHIPKEIKNYYTDLIGVTKETNLIDFYHTIKNQFKWDKIKHKPKDFFVSDNEDGVHNLFLYADSFGVYPNIKVEYFNDNGNGNIRFNYTIIYDYKKVDCMISLNLKLVKSYKDYKYKHIVENIFAAL